MAALYSHTTRAIGTTLTATIYNADHQNHITNGVPAQLDDYSASVSEMQTTTNPGELGSESQAGSLAGEIERLRFAILEIKQVLDSNVAQWYQTPEALTATPRLPTWYIDGLELNCLTSSPAYMEVATGICRDAADTINMRVSTPLHRTVTAAWVTVATGGGNAGATWTKFITKYVFVIKTAASTFDIGFDSVLSASNLLALASGTKFRRIGAVRTATVAGQFQTIAQLGNEVAYRNLFNPSLIGALPSGDSANILTTVNNVPTGIELDVKIHTWVTGTGHFHVNHIRQSAFAGAMNAVRLFGPSNPQETYVHTNVSGDVRFNASALSGGAKMVLISYKDERK